MEERSPAPTARTASAGRSWRSRAGEWIRRYGVAELVGTGTALTGSYALHALTGNEILAAYGGAFGENVGFYGVIIAREVAHDARACRSAGLSYRMRDASHTARNLVLEFGAAELLDGGVIRPLAMGLATSYLGRELGVIVGKLVADVSFYVPAIIAYEVRRARVRE